jgi:hypothetical protein
MKKLILSTIITATLLVCISADLFSQQIPNPRMSPTMISSMNVDGAYVKVVYGMPQKRDREVFGGLVPLNQVWRTGADEATEITFTKDMILGGVEVPAGHYALFTIPKENEWTIILNNGLGQWGAFRYNEELDFARFTVPVNALEEVWEGFRILLVNTDGNLTLEMKWDKTGVTIPFSVK